MERNERSSVGSDCGLESPGGRDAGDGADAAEFRGCPFSFSSSSSQSAVYWNGRSPAEKQGCPKRATRRRRVNLDSLGESLRRLTSPTTQTVQEALQRTLQFYRQQEIRCRDDGNEEKRTLEKCPYLENSGSEEDISGILHYMATILGVPYCELREHLGEDFFSLCFEENERVLRAVGGNLQDFFNGLDAILEHIRTSTGRRASSESPSFQCKDPHEDTTGGEGRLEDGVRGKTLLLHCFNPAPVVGLVMPGIIRAVARRIFHSEVRVEEVPPLTSLSPSDDAEHTGADSSTPTSSPTASPSSSPWTPSPCASSSSAPVCLSFLIRETPTDLRIGHTTFCRAFPFHLVLGPSMELLQLGEGLRKQARIDPLRSLSFRDCFEIVSPKMEPSFQGILLRLASPFTIRTRSDATQAATLAGTKEKLQTQGSILSKHVITRLTLAFLA
ncbi:hypothetical protein NHX12_008986 [Muraenolepis orangiensis]|uniref:guanylate cyclase n=1 Tax=Muraenolepis orangiensis TaxID=630683 RepID=A0A9Q0I9W4_9TELE|nr:hypothetical protein NHX12_008986 [Muraenolepis orangiensis]